MVENGIESYFRWQISRVAFIWWPGTFESVFDERIPLFF